MCVHCRTSQTIHTSSTTTKKCLPYGVQRSRSAPALWQCCATRLLDVQTLREPVHTGYNAKRGRSQQNSTPRYGTQTPSMRGETTKQLKDRQTDRTAYLPTSTPSHQVTTLPTCFPVSASPASRLRSLFRTFAWKDLHTLLSTHSGSHDQREFPENPTLT